MGVPEAAVATLQRQVNVTLLYPRYAPRGFTLYSLRNRPLLYAVDGRGGLLFARSHRYEEPPERDWGTEGTVSYVAPRFINATTLSVIYRRKWTFDIGFYDVAHNALTLVPHRWTRRATTTAHHDLRYNPITRTFLVLLQRAFTRTLFGAERVQQECWIAEINLRGERVWNVQLGDLLLPYWRERLRATGTACGAKGRWGEECEDYLHMNTIFWDVADGVVYANARRLSTFFKIPKARPHVEWACGATGGMQQYNAAGRRVPQLFSGPHEVTKVGPNRFVIFDNNCEQGMQFACGKQVRSRVVEFEVDPKGRWARALREVTLPEQTSWMGSVQLLPGRHLLAHVSVAYATFQVDEAGRVVQRVGLPPDVPSRKYLFLSYRGLRRYRHPLVANATAVLTDPRGRWHVRFLAWDVGPVPFATFGRAAVFAAAAAAAAAPLGGNGTGATQPPDPPVAEWGATEFRFQPYWQPTLVVVPLSPPAAALHAVAAASGSTSASAPVGSVPAVALRLFLRVTNGDGTATVVRVSA